MEKEIYTTKKAKQLLRKKNTIVITDIDHGGTWVILQKDDFINSVLNKGHYFVNYDGEQQSVTYSHHEGYKPTLSIHAPCCVSDNPKIMIGEDEIFEDLD